MALLQQNKESVRANLSSAQVEVIADFARAIGAALDAEEERICWNQFSGSAAQFDVLERIIRRTGWIEQNLINEQVAGCKRTRSSGEQQKTNDRKSEVSHNQ